MAKTKDKENTPKKGKKDEKHDKLAKHDKGADAKSKSKHDDKTSRKEDKTDKKKDKDKKKKKGHEHHTLPLNLALGARVEIIEHDISSMVGKRGISMGSAKETDTPRKRLLVAVKLEGPHKKGSTVDTDVISTVSYHRQVTHLCMGMRANTSLLLCSSSHTSAAIVPRCVLLVSTPASVCGDRGPEDRGLRRARGCRATARHVRRGPRGGRS